MVDIGKLNDLGKQEYFMALEESGRETSKQKGILAHY
jgi:hypothetical protein